MPNDDLNDLGGIEIKNDDLTDLGGVEVGTKPPASEGFLQKAIKAFTPQSREELRDIPQLAMNAAGINTPLASNPLGGPVEMGSKMFGLGKDMSFEQSIKQSLEPKTPWGQEMNKDIGIAQMLIPGAIGAKRLGVGAAKGLGNFVGSMRTSPIKKSISALEEAISGFGKESEALSYEASQRIPKALSEKIKQANTQYGALADQAESQLTKQESHAIIDDMIEKLELKGREVLTSEEQWVLDKAKNMLPELSKTSTSTILDKLGKPIVNVTEKGSEKIGFHDWKAIVKMMRDNLSPKSHVLTQFYKSADPIISKTIPELAQANELRAPLYAASKNIKTLKQPRFKEIATGDLSKISPQEIQDIVNAEKSVGTNYSQQAGRLGEKVQKAKKGLSESQKALEKAKIRRVATLSSLGTLGGLGVISKGLSSLKKMIAGE